MDKQRAISLLETLIESGKQLDLENDSASERWQLNCRAALERIFGAESRQVSEFQDVRWFSSLVSTYESENRRADAEARTNARRRCLVILGSCLEEVTQFWDSDQCAANPDPLRLVERLCDRFHVVARTLRRRHDARQTLEVTDEYDVQDLLHALLLLDFDDVRPEEWTPSYAGAAARMDFLLKKERIVLETKKTRKGLGANEVGAQLLVDCRRYQEHVDCRTLVCFVYDPEGLIGNPRGLENDLAKANANLQVRVFIRPQ